MKGFDDFRSWFKERYSDELADFAMAGFMDELPDGSETERMAELASRAMQVSNRATDFKLAKYHEWLTEQLGL